MPDYTIDQICAMLDGDDLNARLEALHEIRFGADRLVKSCLSLMARLSHPTEKYVVWEALASMGDSLLGHAHRLFATTADAPTRNLCAVLLWLDQE